MSLLGKHFYSVKCRFLVRSKMFFFNKKKEIIIKWDVPDILN